MRSVNHTCFDIVVNIVIVKRNFLCNNRLCFSSADISTVFINSLNEIRLISYALICKGISNTSHLKRSNTTFGITDTCLKNVTYIPVHIKTFEFFGSSKIACGVACFDTRMLTKTVKSSIIGNSVDSKTLGKLVEIDITRNLDSLCYRNMLVITRTVNDCVDIGIVSVTIEGCITENKSLIKTCGSSNGLEGRTRAVKTVCCTIDERRILRV